MKRRQLRQRLLEKWGDLFRSFSFVSKALTVILEATKNQAPARVPSPHRSCVQQKILCQNESFCCLHYLHDSWHEHRMATYCKASNVHLAAFGALSIGAWGITRDGRLASNPPCHTIFRGTVGKCEIKLRTLARVVATPPPVTCSAAKAAACYPSMLCLPLGSSIQLNINVTNFNVRKSPM